MKTWPLLIFSRGTRAQHLTLSVWCVVCVCPLNGCDTLIGQRDNCTVTVSVYSTLHMYTQPWARHSHKCWHDYGHIVAGIYYVVFKIIVKL